MENQACCVDPEKVSQIRELAHQDEAIYDLADFFKLFGDSTRLKILFALSHGEVCVGDLAEALGLSQSSVSHQLRTLRQNNVVKFRKMGKIVYYSLDDEHVGNLLNQGLEHMNHQ
ncbi:MAG: metalloregulator ArsR/SmtB family transcription factor [Turicibacter sp.]|nr:metalloregulator ArsR/SmtB family transcription factor [Turicibacter sp.]